MKRTSRELSIHRQGFTLVMVMSVLVLLLILGWGLMNLGLQGQLFAIRTGSQINARTAADAGLTMALVQMNQLLQKSPFSIDGLLPGVADEALPHCDATYTYTVVGDKDSGYKIQSTGKSGTQQRTVNASLRLRGLFDFGIIVKERAVFYSGTLVDGYNSSDLSDKDVWVQVASVNPDPQSVILKSGAAVDGEILFGVDYDFPTVTWPPVPNVGTELNVKGKTITLQPADSGIYSAVTMLGDTLPGVIEVAGGDVVLCVTGDVWMGQGCELVIKQGASLTVFINGNWVAGNSSGINNETQIPENFAIYGTGQNQTLDLKAKTDWYGTIYAPEADISINAKSDVYGAIVGNTFDSKSCALINYDAALRTVDVDDIGVRFVVDRWSE